MKNGQFIFHIYHAIVGFLLFISIGLVVYIFGDLPKEVNKIQNAQTVTIESLKNITSTMKEVRSDVRSNTLAIIKLQAVSEAESNQREKWYEGLEKKLDRE